MTWYPLAFLPPQYDDGEGVPYSGAVLKAYEESTSTVIALATDYTGATLSSSIILNEDGYPVYGGNVIIPHVQENYDLALYPNQAAADADSGALWTVPNIQIADVENDAFFQSFSGDGTTTEFTLSVDLGTDEKTLMVFADLLDEFTTNGGFSTDEDWTKGVGWTIADGVAKATATDGDLEQSAAILMHEGESYTLTFTVSDYSAGTITPNMAGTAGTGRTANGTHIETIVAGATQLITFTGSTTFTGNIDNVSLTRENSTQRKVFRPDEYTLENTTLTLDIAPQSGTKNVLVFAPSLLFGAVGAAAAAAAVSETNAATSETNAATSETNAATSETNAATSESAASASAAAAASSAAEGLYNEVVTKTFADSPFIPLLSEEGYLFKVDTSGGNVVVNLSELSVYGEDMKFAFVKETGDANTLTINAGGSDTIEGSSSIILSSQWETHVLIGDSTTGVWIDTVQSAAIADNSVTNAKLSDMATSTIKGRVTAGTGDPEDLTAAQARAVMDVYNKSEVDDLVTGITLETEQATTSGTAFDFTSIPSGTKRITVMFDGVDLTGSDEIMVQLGDSGGLETSGYTSQVDTPQSGGTATSTSGFLVLRQTLPGDAAAVLDHMGGNKWLMSSMGKTLTSVCIASGIKTLSGELDRLRITRSGTDTFNAGAVNISYE